MLTTLWQLVLGVVAAVIGAELIAPPIFGVLTGGVPTALFVTSAATAVLVSFPIVYVFARLASRAQEAERQERITAAALHRSSRFYAAVSDINQVISRRAHPDTLFENVCQLLVEHSDAALVWIGYYDADSGAVTPKAAAGPALGYVQQPLFITTDPSRRESGGVVGQALRRSAPVVINDLHADEGMSPWHDWAAAFNLNSVSAYPLRRYGEAIGILVVYAAERDFFDGTLGGLLADAADDIGFALDNHDRDAALEVHARAVSQAAEAIVMSDAGFRIRSVNAAFTRLTGYEPEVVLGRRLRGLLGSDTRLHIREILTAFSERNHWRGELCLRRATGEPLTVSASLARVDAGGDGAVHYVGVFLDLTPYRQLEARVEYLAYHDALTGLANRHWLDQQIAQIFAHHHERWVFLLVDVDHFKQINDGQGHSTGDEVLRLTGQRLRQLMRDEGHAVRLGGDEFIVLARVGDRKEAWGLAQRVMQRLSDPYRRGEPGVSITVSVGLVMAPDDGREWPRLRQNLDWALHQAKIGGRARCVAFESDMRTQAEHATELEKELRAALLKPGELELHYQPIFAAADAASLWGVEALLRWNHPRHGVLDAGEFMSVAQSNHLITKIDNWVLSTAVQQLRLWERAGWCPGKLSINLSAAQCANSVLPVRLRRILKRTGIEHPQRLGFEIIETVLTDDDATVRSVLNALREQGHPLYLDDWGVGYARLDYLTRASVDGLKIDRRFIDDVDSSERSREAVRAVIDFGHALGVRIVAEGVERQAQLDCLRTLGCDAIQGHLLARPLPASEIVRYAAAAADPNS